MTLPQAVIFDWDNTLADNWGAVTDAMNAALEGFGREKWSEEETKRRCDRALRDSFPEWFGADWERAKDLFYAKYAEVQEKRLSPMKGAAELLAWLREKNVPMFVVSNKKGDVLRREAEILGWTGHFVAIIGSTDAPRDKPARDPVDLALGKAGIIASDSVWFVGDKEIDSECAHNSGCRAVMVNKEFNAEKRVAEQHYYDCFDFLEFLRQ